MLSKLKDMFSTNYYNNTNITKQYSSEPLVIRINEPITTKENERINTTLRERGINAILIPSYMEVIQTKVNDYRIFTMEEYKKYRLSGLNAENINRKTVKEIEEWFNSISKGWNFIIGVGKDKLMFYSVPYFNAHVLNDKENKTN